MNSLNVDPIAMRPNLAAPMIGVGLTRLYELINAGELISYTDGRRRLITVESLKRYNERKLAAARKGPAQSTEKATAASLAARRLNPSKRRQCRARQMVNTPTRGVGSSP